MDIQTQRIDSSRPRPCCMCGATVEVRSSTTPNPEAPEMVQLPEGAWIGFVRGDEYGPEMIVVCSDACRLNLLRH